MAAPIRRSGPVLGHGVETIEKPSKRPVTPSELGGAVIVGVFARGSVNTVADPLLNKCTSKEEVLRKLGGRIPNSLASDGVSDYFDASQGAGTIYALRVTDGLEVPAELVLYGRTWGTAVGASQTLTDNQNQVKSRVLKVKAKNGGRWAGRRRFLDAKLPNGDADLLDVATATVMNVETGLTMLADEWKGSTLALDGITGKTYEVISNTITGGLLLGSGTAIKTDYAAGSNLHFTLTLAQKSLDTGGHEAIAVVVKDGATDPVNRFGLDIYLDGQRIGGWGDLSMDPLSAYYAPSIAAADDANTEIILEDLVTAGTPQTPDLRPANFYMMPTAAAATALTFPLGVVISASDTAIKVVNLQKAAVDPIPHRLTLTWSASANEYAVVATEVWKNGLLKNLPAFAVGNGEQLGKTYDPINAATLKITVDHTGGEPADGATLVIDVLPLPKQGNGTSNEAVGGAIIPDMKVSPFTRYRISEIDVHQAKILSGDFSTQLALNAAGATVTSGKAGTYDTTVRNLLKIAVDGATAIEVTLTGGAARTAAQVCADINAAFAASLGYHLAEPATVGAGTGFKLTSRAGGKNPSSSSVQILAASVAANDAALGAATAATNIVGLAVATTTGTRGFAASKGTVVGSIAQTYAVLLGVSDAMLIAIDGRKEVAVTLTAGGAITAAAIAAEINAAFALQFTDAPTPASVTADNRLQLASAFYEGGTLSSVQVKTVAAHAYTLLGLAVGTVRGFWGTEAMVSYAEEMTGGYDGAAPADQKYLDALDVVNTPLHQLEGQGAGVLQMCVPGVTSTAVQKQGFLLADAMNYDFAVEFPLSVTTDQGAIDYINTTIGRSDLGQAYFPSRVNIVDPDKAGVLKSVSVNPMVLGWDARMAANRGAYAPPAAGVQATLPKVVSLPTGKRILNEELLTPRGINVVKKIGADYVIWGDQMLFVTSDFRQKPHRLQMSHWEHTLGEQLIDIIYSFNDSTEWAATKARIIDFFRPDLARRVLNGKTIYDAVRVKADSENNTQADIDAGLQTIEIGVWMTGITEHLRLIFSKEGVFEGTSAT